MPSVAAREPLEAGDVFAARCRVALHRQRQDGRLRMQLAAHQDGLRLLRAQVDDRLAEVDALLGLTRRRQDGQIAAPVAAGEPGEADHAATPQTKSSRLGGVRTAGVPLLVGSRCPVCQKAILRDRQTVCFGRCRAKRWRDSRATREPEIRAALEAIARLAQVTLGRLETGGVRA